MQPPSVAAGAGLVDMVREKDYDNSENFQALSEDLVHAAATEGVSRGDIACMNISDVSANEEAATLEGRRYRDRCGSTARAVQQIDSFVRGAPGARDVFPAHR